jgi:hypothetical protein
VFPCGARTATTNIAFAAGQTVTQLVLTRVGTAGKVCVVANARVQLVVDVHAAFPAS